MSWFQQLKQIFSGNRGAEREQRSAEDPEARRGSRRQPSDAEIAAIPDKVERATAHYNRAIAYHHEDKDLNQAISSTARC